MVNIHQVVFHRPTWPHLEHRCYHLHDCWMDYDGSGNHSFHFLIPITRPAGLWPLAGKCQTVSFVPVDITGRWALHQENKGKGTMKAVSNTIIVLLLTVVLGSCSSFEPAPTAVAVWTR